MNETVSPEESVEVLSRAVFNAYLNKASSKSLSSLICYYKIATLISEGKMSKEIGAVLNLSPRTVETYIINLRDAFQAKTQAHLIAILFKKGILK